MIRSVIFGVVVSTVLLGVTSALQAAGNSHLSDATELRARLVSGDLTAKKLYGDIAARVEANRALNAFVSLHFDEALKNAEEQVKSGAPFGGVPVALKMLGQTKKGWEATAGSRLFKGYRAANSNNYVLALEKAGFVPFAQTNAPEFGFKNVTDPVIYGPARNPLDLSRTPGGSSGGAAAAVAAGVIPLACASDGGGSIRIPATFCGLIGLKPSRGMVTAGPDGYRDWQGASISFALGISVRDLKTLLPLLAPGDRISPYLPPAMIEIPDRPFRIAACVDSPVGNPVTRDAVEAFEKTVALLRDMGHSVDFIEYPVDGPALIRSYYAMNGGETAHMMGDIEKSIGRELTYNDMEPMTWTIWQYGKKLSAGDYSASFDQWDKATVTMEKLFTEYDFFLSPTATAVAPKIDRDLQSDEIRERMKHASELDRDALECLVYDMFESSLHITPYTQLANLTGEPAISLPLYETSEGLPIGSQFMAAKGGDYLLLELARRFEENGDLILPPAYRK